MFWALCMSNGQGYCASDDECESTFEIKMAKHAITVHPIQSIGTWEGLQSIVPQLFDQSSLNHKNFVYVDGDETMYRTSWMHPEKKLEWVGCPDRARTYFLDYATVLNAVYKERPELVPCDQTLDMLDAKICEGILHAMNARKIGATVGYEVLDHTFQGVKEGLNSLPQHITLISGQPSNDKKMTLLKSLGITEYREASTSDKAFSLIDDVSVCLKTLCSKDDYDPYQPLTILLVDNSRLNVLNKFASNIERICNLLIPEDWHKGDIQIYPIEFTHFKKILEANQQALFDEFVFYFENSSQKL